MGSGGVVNWRHTKTLHRQIWILELKTLLRRQFCLRSFQRMQFSGRGKRPSPRILPVVVPAAFTLASHGVTNNIDQCCDAESAICYQQYH